MFLDPSLLVRAANATLNVAAESTPMQQCKDIDHCRTLLSIILGCFSTVFLCTWTALHLDVPYPPLLERVMWMMLALIAPEMVFMRALDNWTDSSDLLDKILKNYPDCGWTVMHAHFVIMKGFNLVDADGKTFRDCVQDGTIVLPDVPEDVILGLSRGDIIAKSITLIQTAWFVFQCIHRRSQHLLLTQLEITTLAHTLINFFIYFFWWHKPYGVALQIKVRYRERSPETIGGRDDKVEPQGGSSDGPKNDNMQAPQTTKTGETPTQPPPISNNDPSKVEEGLFVVSKSRNGKTCFASTVDKELESDVEVSIPPTPPQHSRCTRLIRLIKYISSQLSRWYTRLGVKTGSLHGQAARSLHGQIVLYTIYLVVGGGFGAMHCLAWNSTFPTRAEQHIWQVSSLIVTVFGGTMLVYFLLIDVFTSFKNKGTVDQLVIIVSIFILTPIYCLARVALLVLALLQLRAIPYAGYATPSWSIFYPHIG